MFFVNVGNVYIKETVEKSRGIMITKIDRFIWDNFGIDYNIPDRFFKVYEKNGIIIDDLRNLKKFNSSSGSSSSSRRRDNDELIN